ncbi:MAG: CPBP family intramembrane metalloprotease, partial [Gemmatimonadales bacterium]|nr:CPBP family intramembrane metalloprotease [Gemmatimonadales bacterium]
ERAIPLPPRLTLYASAVLGIGFLALLTIVVMVVEGAGFSEIGLRVTGAGTFLGWTAAVTVGTLAGNFVISQTAARLGLRESRLTYHLMPRNGRERWAFLAVSASAGFGEELTYHGFLLAGLAAWLGNGWWAAVVANLAFGILHGYQGPAGAVRAFAMGYVLCLPVVVGAGLWPAVAAHFLVNALLGLGMWRWMVPVEQRLPEAHD